MDKVIVIGGGAAGCMAAITAGRRGKQVTLIEKNEKLGKKVFITGKGRCNVTNACDTEDLFRNVVSNPKFLYSAFYGFDNTAVMEFFEKGGCPLKTERGGRVFPVSDHSSDIIKVLEKELKKADVTVLNNTKVQSLKMDNNKIAGVILSNGSCLSADSVVIATGGMSYPATGSDGDGHKMAEKAGIQVTDCRPALVPFHIKEEYCKSLQGLALKNVKATLLYRRKEIYSDFGEMLFTHFGVSGPLILSAGSIYAKKAGKDSKNQEELCTLRLDLKPALTLEQLDRRILRDFEECKNKQFKNAIGGLFPIRLIPVMIEVSGIHPDKRIHEISREERLQFVHRIKNWDLTITKTRNFEEAIITQGGVCVKEINPSTMETKKISGLYFAGEILDTDALTGGFNLQIAWSTGYLAGCSV